MSAAHVAIQGVWLIKSHAHLGNDIRVIVEIGGRLYEVISTKCDDGPISHYAHPSGITKAKDVTDEFKVTNTPADLGHRPFEEK